MAESESFSVLLTGLLPHKLLQLSDISASETLSIALPVQGHPLTGFWIDPRDKSGGLRVLDFGFWINSTDKSGEMLYHQGIIGQKHRVLLGNERIWTGIFATIPTIFHSNAMHP